MEKPWIRRGIYVDSTLNNGQQVDRYFLTSNPRRFNVDIYPAIGRVDCLRRFDVDSTSKSICADMVFFQRRFNVHSTLKFSSTRTVDSSTTNICRFHVDASSTVFDVKSMLNTRRFNVEISLYARLVDSSTSNILWSHVEVPPRYELIFWGWMHVDSTLFPNQ